MDDSQTWSFWRGELLRGRRTTVGFSAARLAERCSDLGFPIHRVAIGKMEDGKRVPTIDELLVIAAALNTSPVMLLIGDRLPDRDVEVIPGLRTAANHALNWMTGSEPLTRDVDGGRYRYSNRAVTLTMELDALRQRLNAVYAAMTDSFETENEVEINIQKALALELTVQIDATRAALSRLGNLDDDSAS